MDKTREEYRERELKKEKYVNGKYIKGKYEKGRQQEDGQGKETVLVTGATGFLGEYIVRRLTKRYRVLAMGRNRERGAYVESLGAVFCPGELTDRKSCEKYFQNARYVIHAGALSTVWGKWEDFYRINVQGTALVAELCRLHGVKRLVFISSPSIYTERRDRLGIREEEAPERNDLNYYIKSKLLAEREIARQNRMGLETVILRPRGLIGIGDTSLVPRLLRANGRIGIPLFHGGDNLVDLTSVENAAQACELAMTAEGASGCTFNITNGEPMAFRAILEQFLAAIGERPRYMHLPFWLLYFAAGRMEAAWRLLKPAGEPPLTRYTVCTLGFAQTMDISWARDILAYVPEKTLAESIGEYGAWWRSRERAKERAEVVESKGEGMVDRVRIYRCGHCTNNLKLIYRKRPWEKRVFPARAALIHHKRLGNILFDAGYSRRIFQRGVLIGLYRLLNPVTLKRGETIGEQLARDGISPGSVGTVILSHAHPDHIGGLSQLKGYRLIALEEVLEALERPRLGNLTFPGLLPERERMTGRYSPKRCREHFLCAYFEDVYDLFCDGSVIGVRLDGHSRGQMGIYIPDLQLFLGADACWGRDLISAAPHMRLPVRLIQDDFSAYRDSIRRICRMKREHGEIRVIFTHDK